jgi:hypothetical protein
MPQKLGHDVDLNTLPLVAFTEKVAKKIGILTFENVEEYFQYEIILCMFQVSL